MQNPEANTAEIEPVDFTERERLIMAIASEVALRLLQLQAMDPGVAAAANKIVAMPRARGRPEVSAHAVTAREAQVLRLILAGLTNKEAGRELGLSPRTVEVHRHRIMEKLDARNTAALFVAARKAGLVE